MKRWLTVLCFASVMAFACDARATLLSLRTTPSLYDYECDIADPGPGGEVIVYVALHYNYNGALAVEFSAPLPASAGFTHTYDEPMSQFLMIGDSQSGVGVAFGQCLSGDVAVMAMHFVRTSSDPCVVLLIGPHPTDGLVYVDCDFNLAPLTRGDGVILNSDGTCSKVSPPYNPDPVDGVTDVGATPQLSWSFDNPICEGDISGRDDRLYFGTTPSPPLLMQPVISPHPVGPLQPHTTYYWKVSVRAYGGADHTAESPVWSFTTAQDLAVKTSTWGAIKALYRGDK